MRSCLSSRADELADIWRERAEATVSVSELLQWLLKQAALTLLHADYESSHEVSGG